MTASVPLLLATLLQLGGDALWPFAPEAAPAAVLADFHTPMATGEARAYLHGGVDLRAPPGTEVRAVTGGWVWLYRQGAYDNIVLTEESGDTWEFRHLVPGSIPGEVIERAAAGLPISAGAGLGRVPRWGDTGYDHIHLNRRSSDGRVLDPLARLPSPAAEGRPVVRAVHLLPHAAADAFTPDEAGVVVVQGLVDIAVDACVPLPGTGFSAPPIALTWSAGEGDGQRFAPFEEGLPTAYGQPVPRYPMRDVDVAYVLRGPTASHNPTYTPEGQRWVLRVTAVDGAGRLDSSAAWDTRGLPDGELELVVRAEDRQGRHGTMAVRVRISNAAPPPSPVGAPRPSRRGLAAFAAAWPGEPVRWRFPLVHDGARPWELEVVDPPDGVSVEELPERLLPGERGELAVFLDSAAPALGSRFVDLRIRRKGARYTAHLVYEVVPFLEVMPPRPRFAPREGERDPTAELCLSARAPFQVMGAEWRLGSQVYPVELEAVRQAGPLGRAYLARLPVEARGDGQLLLRARDGGGRLREQAVPATVSGAR